MLWTKMTIQEVVEKLETNLEGGLTPPDIKMRREIYGLNQFAEEKKETLIQRIGHHLLEISSIILLVAAAIAGYMAWTVGYGWAKVWVILAIVVINICLGIYQESKAEAALEALKKMNAFQTTVLRCGRLLRIDAAELVPGDVVELAAGDIITADARLLSSASLQVEEAALTGESVPVEKDHLLILENDVPLGDRLNMVYSGCLVTGGRGQALVVATGMETEMGKIAGLLNDTSKIKTPLQMRLHELSKRLCAVALFSGFVMFLIGTLLYGDSVTDMMLAAVALGVAAVPETLPIIVTMILSSGVYTMVQKNTIIRKIPAIETVGNTSVICSDKTGTLTQNKMRIKKVWRAGAGNASSSQHLGQGEQELLELMAACTNAVIEKTEEGERVVGDPTEAAIVRLVRDQGWRKDEIEAKYPRIHELPFDSNRKLMTTVHQLEEGYLVITKGAFDRIPVIDEGELMKQAHHIHDGFASKALRVLAAGYKKLEMLPAELTPQSLEKDLTLLGMVGMMDPPRPESRAAVAHAKMAGIKTVMITGDHVMTAMAIAEEIGIFEEGDQAVTGLELSRMNDQELAAKVNAISVYARVSPEDKIRIVQAWQNQGEVIAMTGDGVNDAPALKAADVGCAMGITGTEVAKSASDMIITDDNFATIVDAISEGRRSFANIRKTIGFLLDVNFAQITMMLLGVIVGWGTIILPVQILLINVISDGIPGFFLSKEKAETGIMERMPRKKDMGIFSDGLGRRIAFRSGLFVILTLTAFYVGTFVSLTPYVLPRPAVGISMAFIVLSIASVINIFNVRSDRESILKLGFLSNPYVFLSAIFSIGITITIALVPVLQDMFHVVPMSYRHWLWIGALSVTQILGVELLKAILRVKTPAAAISARRPKKGRTLAISLPER